MNKLYYILIAVAAILFFTNPSIEDYKSELKTFYNEGTGQEQILVDLVGLAGKLQVCRRNYFLFSVYRTTYKTVLSNKDEPQYVLGIVGSFMALDKNFLCSGSYSDCKNIKTSDMKK